MQQGGGVDTEVTWEDQQNINKFGRLNNRFHELEDEIKAKKEMTENLEDASNELILADEEIVRFQLGEVFSHMPKDDVENSEIHTIWLPGWHLKYGISIY
ncbi:hypothetical protein SUGI_0089040 [Cryptomeria japonica]|nr:hypothetical protein SUGI_0089040 [Cryptomeria japonica]